MKNSNKLVGKKRKFAEVDENLTAERNAELSTDGSEKDHVDLSAMEKAAWKVRKNAYCPYSNFQVGCSLRSRKTGKIYTGCNVENAAFPSAICAERGALMQLVAHEGPKATIDECVVVTNAPEIT